MRYFREQQYYMLMKVAAQLNYKKMSEVASAKVPVLKKLIPEFMARVAEIKTLARKKKLPTYIQTSQKQDAKSGLIESSMKLVDVLCAYHEQENNQLPEEAQYTTSGLKRASAEKLAIICRQIIDAAKEIPDLREYGLSAADLNEAEAWLKEYTSVKSSPQLRRKEMAGQSHDIDSSIKECIRLLAKQLDKLMSIGLKDNKELYARYFSARKVLPRGQGAPSEKEKRYRKSRKSGKKRLPKDGLKKKRS